MVAQMAGGVDHFQIDQSWVSITFRRRQARYRAGNRSIDAFATSGQTLGGKAGHDFAAPSLWPAKSQNRRAGAGGQGGRQRGMVQMGVGDKDMWLILCPGSSASRIAVRCGWLAGPGSMTAMSRVAQQGRYWYRDMSLATGWAPEYGAVPGCNSMACPATGLKSSGALHSGLFLLPGQPARFSACPRDGSNPICRAASMPVLP